MSIPSASTSTFIISRRKRSASAKGPTAPPNGAPTHSDMAASQCASAPAKSPADHRRRNAGMVAIGSGAVGAAYARARALSRAVTDPARVVPVLVGLSAHHLVAGEITTKTYVDIPRLVRDTVERILESEDGSTVAVEWKMSYTAAGRRWSSLPRSSWIDVDSGGIRYHRDYQ